MQYTCTVHHSAYIRYSHVALQWCTQYTIHYLVKWDMPNHCDLEFFKKWLLSFKSLGSLYEASNLLFNIDTCVTSEHNTEDPSKLFSMILVVRSLIQALGFSHPETLNHPLWKFTGITLLVWFVFSHTISKLLMDCKHLHLYVISMLISSFPESNIGYSILHLIADDLETCSITSMHAHDNIICCMYT